MKSEKYLIPVEVSSAFPMPVIQVAKGVYPDYNEAAKKLFPELEEVLTISSGKRMKFLDDQLKKNKNEIYRDGLRYLCTLIKGKGDEADKKLYIFQEKSDIVEIFQENQRLICKIEGEFLNLSEKEREREKDLFNLNQAKEIKIRRNMALLEEENLYLPCVAIDGLKLVEGFVETTGSCLEEIDVTLQQGKCRPVELRGNLHFICRSLLGLLAVLIQEKKQNFLISIEKEGKNGKILLKSSETVDLSKCKDSGAVETVKKIWFAMGGDFLSSTTSEGTDFIFYLPAEIKKNYVATVSLQDEQEINPLTIDDTGGFGNLYVEFSSILPVDCYSDAALDL